MATLLTAPDTELLARSGEDPGPGQVRLGIVAPDARRLALARRAVERGRPWRGKGDVWFTPEPLLTAGTGKLAFVFPGLEAEFEPQVDEVAEHFGLPRPGAAEVGDVARHGLGVLGVGRVLDAALRKLGLVPDAVAGHSIGEWSAMYAGGLYDDAAADELLGPFDPDSLRVPGVVFAAVGAPAERVEAVLGGRTDIVLSHDNAPGQSMVCGPENAVADLVADFRAERVIAQVLPFRSGFHTPMLAPYLGPLTEGVRRTRVRPARIPVWSGTTAAPYPEGAEPIRELFVRHLLEPVRFRPLIEAMYAAGFRVFVQVGTGQLASLITDTLQGRDFLAVAANSPRRSGLAQLRRVSTALWTEGRSVGRAPAPRSRASAPVRLDLGGALVSLPDGIRDELRSAVRDAVRAAPAEATAAGAALGGAARSGSAGDALTALARHADHHPAAAELHAALAETASSAAAVLAAAGSPSAAPAPSGYAPRARDERTVLEREWERERERVTPAQRGGATVTGPEQAASAGRERTTATGRGRTTATGRGRTTATGRGRTTATDRGRAQAIDRGQATPTDRAHPTRTET
ncbi:acyltransferase domain-containing protein, partial [Streptomyces coryli]|uniref:acyltransferase domain-containing protein n=1 Tax=Streptomyces coryli TaxID=1128680 RepID=UPI0030B8EE29